MATSKSLKNCITTAAPTTKDKLPENITKAAQLGRRDLIVDSLDQYINNLKVTQQNIVDQHNENKKQFTEQSTANSLVSHPDDPNNELNHFRPANIKALVNNFVQQVGSVIKATTNSLFNKHEKAIAKHFNEEFNPKFSSAIDTIYKVKEGNSKKFRYEDMIQYFAKHTEDDKAVTPFLNPIIKETMAATAYEWLGNEGSINALGQTEDSLRILLRLEKDEPIPKAARDNLMGVGAHTKTLAASLGRRILDRLSIKDTPDSDALAKKRLEMSLGLMAIGALQYENYLERQEVNVKALQRLANDENLSYEEFFFDQKLYQDIDTNPEKREKNPTMKFVLLKHTKNEQNRMVPTPDIVEIEEKMDLASDVFDKLFGTESNLTTISWKKIVLPKNMKIGRTRENPTTEQKANLQKYTDIPLTSSDHALSAFEAFLDQETDPVIKQALDSILGRENIIEDENGNQLIPGKLNVRLKSAEGTNRSIDRDIASIRRWLRQSRELGKSVFYIPNEFTSNTRMLQKGLINPQNSKIHRNLFAPKGWETKFNPNYRKKITNKKGLDKAFHEAIAFALDIESGKVGGVDKQLQKLNDLLKSNINIQLAIEAFQEFDKTGKMTAEMAQDIAAGVNETDTKLHAFKGLQEYARYLNHKAKPAKSRGEFTTDIYKEDDGVSNGPLIGTAMFISNAAKGQATLATLAMGGMSINTKEVNLDEYTGPGNPNLHDAYQRMGEWWAVQLLKLKQVFKDKNDSKSKFLFKKAESIEYILGSFQDENGIITKIIRSLSKPRTMQTLYGAGIKRQNQILTGNDVIQDGIYKKMEEFLQEESGINSYKFQEFLSHVNTIANSNFKVGDFVTNGRMDRSKMAAFYLNQNQIQNVEQAVNATHGKAMKEAINVAFKASIDARKPFLEGVQLAITQYNTVLETKVNAVIENKIQAKLTELGNNFRDFAIKKYPEINRITKRELDEIIKEIEPLMPKIKTPLGGYLPVASIGKNKQYAQQSQTKQVYNSGTIIRQWGHPEGIPFLDPAGAAPIVKAIQMIDAMVANHAMGLGIHILNNHDGFSYGLADGEILNEGINKRFYEILSNYSLGSAFNEMQESTFKAATETLNELGVDKDTLFEKLLDDDAITPETAAYVMSSPIEDVKQAYWETGSLRSVFGREDFSKLYDSVTKRITSNTQIMSTEVSENQFEFMRHVTESAQYPQGGKGYKVDRVSDNDTLWGIPVDKVLDVDAQNSIKNASTIQELMDSIYEPNEEYGSNIDDDDISRDVNDYPDPSRVDSMNVTQVFETITEQDKQADFGSIPVSDDHKGHLTRILNDIVSKVMSPVQLYMRENNLDEETKGVYDVDDQRIWLQRQKVSNHPKSGMLGQGIRMSAAEVYAHELVHHITHAGVKQSAYHRKQAYDLLEFTYKAFTNRYGNNAFRVFMNDPDADITDPANAFEVMAAKDRWEYIFNSESRTNGANHRVEEFLAFGLTNENFKRELATLTLEDVPKNKAILGIFEKNVQQTAINLFNMIMDFIHQTFLKEQHSKRVDLELENLATAISSVDSMAKTGVYKRFVNVSETITATSLNIDEKMRNTASKAMSATQLGQVIQKLKQLPEYNNMISHRLRVLLQWYNDSEAGLIPSIVTEMQGTTERLKPLHALLNRRNRVIDAAKSDAASNMRNVVNSWFSRELTTNEKISITKGLLKTDVSALLHKFTARAIQGFVIDEQQREDQIQTLIREFDADPSLKAYKYFFEKASDDLGYYMVTSKARKDGLPMMNAHNIALMKGTKHADALSRESFNKAVDIIEQLATLSALRYISKADRNRTSELIDQEWEAIESVLQHHQLLKERALRESFNGSPALMQKGYTKAILDPRIQYEEGTLADKEQFERMGYIMQKSPLPRDPDDPVQEDIYLFKSNLGTANNLQAGIVSYTQNSGKGKNQYRIQQQLGNTVDPAATAYQNEKHMQAVVRNKLNKMFSATPRQANAAQNNKNYMIPKFDINGDIVEMRYMMSEQVKDTVLQQHHEFDAVLGAMTSQIVDKKHTPEINAELVDALKDLYDADFGKYPEAFVDISPYSSNQRYRDIYHMLPNVTKEKIETVWGRPGMKVPQDVVNLSFGQHKYSIIEMFNKDRQTRNLFETVTVDVLTFALGIRNPFTDTTDSSATGRAINRAKRLEEFMIQITSLAKSNIVVRNFGVTHGNYMSNMAYLLSKGVPAHEVLKGSREALNSAVQYQNINSKLNTLKAQKEVIERKTSINQADKDKKINSLNRVIARLENELAHNPSTDMIAAGLMPQIVDDVDTANIQSPYKFGIDKFIDDSLSKLPSKLEKASRVLFMTEDSEGFKMLNNAVKMTDYVGRYVLYNHYTKKKGMSHEDAISAVSDEFINFDLPTHKILEYGNNVGILWFSKYQLRVLKHIKNVLKDQPFTAISVFILGSFFGNNNIINSIPGLTKGALQGISEPLRTFADSADQILYYDMAESVASFAVE